MMAGLLKLSKTKRFRKNLLVNIRVDIDIKDSEFCMKDRFQF